MIAKEKILLFIFLGVIVSTMALFSFEKFPQDKIAFGVKIANINVGGKTNEESKKIIQDKIADFNNKPMLVVLETEENKKQGAAIRISQLKPEYQVSETLKEAFSLGKEKNFFKNIKEKILALLGRRNLALNPKISEEELDNFLTKNFGSFENPPKNSGVIFEEKKIQFIVSKSQSGELFPRDKIKNKIEDGAQFLELKDICLSKNNKYCFNLEKESPQIKEDQAELAKKEAEEILNAGSYLIFAADKSFLIKNSTLGKWFVFLPQKSGKSTTLKIDLNEELIKNYLLTLSKEVNTDPQNPTLSFTDGSLKIISPPKSGKSIKIDESVQKIKSSILDKKTKIVISLENKDPLITEEKINELQIEKLIGKGTSNFSGSPKNRINNIRVGSARFNGVLIAPGETFSFNKTLGEVGPTQGYLPELVIKNNKTVPEYGGGICQISTTIFRAAVNSGLEILERHAHAYPVKYYNPQGFDATVYLPRPDLIFKNNTPGYILIQSKIEGNNLTFEFYGKDDGRVVIVRGPYQYDIQSDGSMKARLEEIVKIGENIIYQKTFLSSYKSPSLFPVEKKNPLE